MAQSWGPIHSPAQSKDSSTETTTASRGFIGSPLSPWRTALPGAVTLITSETANPARAARLCQRCLWRSTNAAAVVNVSSTSAPSIGP